MKYKNALLALKQLIKDNPKDALLSAFGIRVMDYLGNNHNTNNNIVVVREFDSYKRYKLYELNNLHKEFLSLEIDKVTVKEKENE